jgi:protein-tyrosine phosphatase
MAAHSEQRLDASNVATRLWVGGKPPFDRDLPDFDLLVLSAQELQPSELAFHGRVLRCPIPDGALDHQELTRAVLAAMEVGNALVVGRRVLVTCAAGLNRSALIASLALARATKMTADEIIHRMRQRRSPNALYNANFQDIIRRLVRR